MSATRTRSSPARPPSAIASALRPWPPRSASDSTAHRGQSESPSVHASQAQHRRYGPSSKHSSQTTWYSPPTSFTVTAAAARPQFPHSIAVLLFTYLSVSAEPTAPPRPARLSLSAHFSRKGPKAKGGIASGRTQSAKGGSASGIVNRWRRLDGAVGIRPRCRLICAVVMRSAGERPR